jgi:hypothetical protein
MLTLDKHIARCEDWMVHPHDAVPSNLITHGGWCIGVTRSSWEIPSLGGSAEIAYESTPRAEIHVSDPHDVPLGAICFYLHGDFGQPRSKFAHATTAARNAQCYTTDYGGIGTLKLEPMNLPNWTGVSTVSWTSWTPFGRLPVGPTNRQVMSAAHKLNRHQLHVIHLVNTHQASAHQIHVVHIWSTTGVWAE